MFLGFLEEFFDFFVVFSVFFVVYWRRDTTCMGDTLSGLRYTAAEVGQWLYSFEAVTPTVVKKKGQG